jgi:long-chain acyl-CoA synthetase
MYPRHHAVARAENAAFIMGASGDSVTYGELEARTNRLAHLFRAAGLRRLDHYSVFMENNVRYVQCRGAGRAILHCINSFLRPEELGYIINNSRSRILITSQAIQDLAQTASRDCPKVELRLVAAFTVSTSDERLHRKRRPRREDGEGPPSQNLVTVEFVPSARHF